VVAEDLDLGPPDGAQVLLERRAQLDARGERQGLDVVQVGTLHLVVVAHDLVTVPFEQCEAPHLGLPRPALEALLDRRVAGGDPSLALLHPAQERGSEAAPAPVGMHLAPDRIVAAAVVVLLPAALGVGHDLSVHFGEEEVGRQVQVRRVVEPAGDLRQREAMLDAVRLHRRVDELCDGGIVGGALDASEAEAGDRGGVGEQDRHR
jgi:hypothetical protein